MSVGGSIEGERGRVGGRLGPALAAAAFLCLAFAGALLWWRHGEGVFSHYLLGALAWCF